MAAVGLVGLGTFGTLSNYLIEKAVESKLEVRTGNITDALEFIKFNSIALKLDLGASFTREQGNAAMQYLRKAATNHRVRHSPEFFPALLQVVESFGAANLSSNMDELFDTYESELLGSMTAIEIFLHHFGQRMLSRTVSPKHDELVMNFEKVEAVAGGAKVPELAMFYRVIYMHNQGAIDHTARNWLERVSLYDDVDRRRFFRELFTKTKAENWQQEPTEQGRYIEAVVRGFLVRHSSLLSEMSSVPERLFVLAGEEGVRDDDVDEVATLVARSFNNGAKKSVALIGS